MKGQPDNEHLNPCGCPRYQASEAVHGWFGLSYASYLVVNRSLLQSMPDEWQRRFVACLEELNAHFAGVPEPLYTVNARDDSGRFIKDPIPNYDRGRTFVFGSQVAADTEENAA